MHSRLWGKRRSGARPLFSAFSEQDHFVSAEDGFVSTFDVQRRVHAKFASLKISNIQQANRIRLFAGDFCSHGVAVNDLDARKWVTCEERVESLRLPESVLAQSELH